MADLEMRQPDGSWKTIGKSRPTETLVRDLQLFGKSKRRVRMCNCPYCSSITPLHPARNGMPLTVCDICFSVFENKTVQSWLWEPKP